MLSFLGLLKERQGTSWFLSTSNKVSIFATGFSYVAFEDFLAIGFAELAFKVSALAGPIFALFFEAGATMTIPGQIFLVWVVTEFAFWLTVITSILLIVLEFASILSLILVPLVMEFVYVTGCPC